MMATFAAVSFIAGTSTTASARSRCSILGALLHRRRPGADRAAAPTRRARRDRPGAGDPRPRGRALLSDGDHGRGDRRRRVAEEPRRRDHLHVPDRGRLGRPGPDHDGLHRGERRSHERRGFIDGIETAFKLDAGLAVGGFVICLLLVGGRLQLPAPPPGPRRPLAARARALGVWLCPAGSSEPPPTAARAPDPAAARPEPLLPPPPPLLPPPRSSPGCDGRRAAAGAGRSRCRPSPGPCRCRRDRHRRRPEPEAGTRPESSEPEPDDRREPELSPDVIAAGVRPPWSSSRSSVRARRPGLRCRRPRRPRRAGRRGRCPRP